MASVLASFLVCVFLAALPVGAQQQSGISRAVRDSLGVRAARRHRRGGEPASSKRSAPPSLRRGRYNIVDSGRAYP